MEGEREGERWWVNLRTLELLLPPLAAPCGHRYAHSHAAGDDAPLEYGGRTGVPMLRQEYDTLSPIGARSASGGGYFRSTDNDGAGGTSESTGTGRAKGADAAALDLEALENKAWGSPESTAHMTAQAVGEKARCVQSPQHCWCSNASGPTTVCGCGSHTHVARRRWRRANTGEAPSCRV